MHTPTLTVYKTKRIVYFCDVKLVVIHLKWHVYIETINEIHGHLITLKSKGTNSGNICLMHPFISKISVSNCNLNLVEVSSALQWSSNLCYSFLHYFCASHNPVSGYTNFASLLKQALNSVQHLTILYWSFSLICRYRKFGYVKILLYFLKIAFNWDFPLDSQWTIQPFPNILLL